ncbi:MAG: hypothetical protein PHV06_02940 [bacterium]|nr:hypothetical protein [bacterium]
MANCECLAKCPFFNDQMMNMPNMATSIKEKYCKGDNSDCARYMVFKTIGREKVPGNLFPHQKDIAETIIKENN